MLSILVYSSSITIGDGYATVHELRNVNLNNGFQQLTLDFYKGVNPSTIIINSDCLSILSQDYKSGLSFQDLPVTVVTKTGVTYEGEIVSSSSVSYTIETSNKTYILPIDSIQMISFDEKSSPELILNVNSQCQGLNDLSMLYMTSGLSWQASYTALYENGILDITGLAEITNNAGDYQDVNLVLVAGEINRVSKYSNSYYDYDDVMYESASYSSAPSGASYSSTQQEQAFEYHTYHVPNTIDLNYGETTVVSLMNIQVPAEKKYTFTAPYWASEDESSIDVSVEFENSEQNNGVELPSGTVRMFTDNGFNGYMLAGEDTISDTPVGEIVTLDIGQAYDIKGKVVRVDSEEYGTFGLTRFEYRDFEITLTNTKDEDVTVEVIGQMPSWGNWDIQNNNDYVQETDTRVKWTVDVPAGDSKVLTYRLKLW